MTKQLCNIYSNSYFNRCKVHRYSYLSIFPLRFIVATVFNLQYRAATFDKISLAPKCSQLSVGTRLLCWPFVYGYQLQIYSTGIWSHTLRLVRFCVSLRPVRDLPEYWIKNSYNVADINLLGYSILCGTKWRHLRDWTNFKVTLPNFCWKDASPRSTNSS